MAKKTYVIDTSVYLSDADCLYRFQNNDIVIPIKVLEEIDKHKKRQDSVGFNARTIIKHLDTLREKGSLSKGIRIEKGKGLVKVSSSVTLPQDLDPSIADHQILGVALSLKEENPRKKVIVVSRDINMRVIADSLGIIAENYATEQVVENLNKLYSGFADIVVDDQLIDQYYLNEEIYLEESKVKLYMHQFIMLISSANPKKTALCRFKGYNVPLENIVGEKRDLSWGINPRNKEQSFAYDLLFDDDVPLVTMIGRAGSGKTLMALAAGIEQTLGAGENKYNKLVVSRPVQPLGKDIGFLPGSMEDKMLPWLKPIQDNMQFIIGNDKTMLESFVERGQIEIEALTYIRGRSIANAFIIIDEAQNLTAHEVKTIITRVGENTKVILTGDIEQIDNVYTNETSNGLAYAIEKFKHSSLSGHITFRKGERSRLATEASKIL